MKYFLSCLFAIMLLCHSVVNAKHKHDEDRRPKTEVELMTQIIECLKYKDSLSYSSLFPTFDSLWQLILHNPDSANPQTALDLSKLKQHPESIAQFDPSYNHDILPRFYRAAQKAEDSGIYWNSVVMERYELQKEDLTRDLVGYDKIATERLKGFVFIRDLLGRTTYCIIIAEMQKIQGYWYGGEVLNIEEASTIDEYFEKEKASKIATASKAKASPKNKIGQKPDTVKETHVIKTNVYTEQTTITKTPAPRSTDSANKNKMTAYNLEQEENKNRKVVVERRYYEGMFDNEIPVQLFVRYMLGDCPEKICFWEAIYKFGDQDKFIKLNVTKTDDGKWTFKTIPAPEVWNLVLKGKVYTGTWLNNENQTGYDVSMKQKDIPQSEIEKLDLIMEKHLWAKPEDFINTQTGKKVGDDNTDNTDDDH